MLINSKICWSKIWLLNFAETKKECSILTETHINHDEIHQIRINSLMMMMMINRLRDTVNRRTAFDLISSLDRCQIPSPSWIKLCSSHNHYMTAPPPGDSHTKRLLALFHPGLEGNTEVDTDPKRSFCRWSKTEFLFMPLQSITSGNS